MAKVDIDLVKHVMVRHDVDSRLAARILEDVRKEIENSAVERVPPVKKQFVILVSDPSGKLKGVDLVGWVLQIPEDAHPSDAETGLVQATYEFNQSPKGRRMPVTAVGEACEVVPARLLKERSVWVKTKEPVLLVTTDNKIPIISPEE